MNKGENNSLYFFKKKGKKMAKKNTEYDPFLNETDERIIERNAEDILGECFGRYSKAIIQDRALPDARDGLKPVQRRILYAMHKIGNVYNKPYHKSAKTVGYVLGSYHPHGDSSVYDAMVRMSQGWKIVTPLIDMQGNNGSIDGDGAAAMRYTEARLSHISDYLLKDIDKGTVDWVPNFSDEEMEPVILPARYPHLLINGINGIASGYATSIPPHNLNEVINATIHRVSNPDCTLDDLMRYVKGPDFPTGGIVMGIDGINSALATGKGKVIIRGKTEVTKNQIIITEIPYEVVKSALVKRIEDLRIDKKLGGVMEVRDESGRNGLRIVLDLKKGAPSDSILNYLYKNTDLQVNLNYNMTAIVDKAPKQIGLIKAIDAFIGHRVEVITRRSEHELKVKRARQHILDGIMKAMGILDEVIKTIRASANKADARANLVSKYDFTEKQAEAIVIMQLYKLTNTDVEDLRAEHEKLAQEIAELEKILREPEELRRVMIEELKEVNEVFPTKRQTVIEGEIKDIVIDEQAMIPSETVMLSVTREGYVKRSSLRSYGASGEIISIHKDGDRIVGQGECNTRDILLFFTDKGNYGAIPVYKLGDSKWKDLGEHITGYVKLAKDEYIIGATTVPSLADKDGVIRMITGNGKIKQVRLGSLTISRTSKPSKAMGIAKGDSLEFIHYAKSEDSPVYITTANGKGLSLDMTKTAPVTLMHSGVKGIKVLEGDRIIGFDSEMTECLIIASKYGEYRRVNKDQYVVQNRGASGKQVMRKDLTANYTITDKQGEFVYIGELENHICHNDLDTVLVPAGYDRNSKPEPEEVEVLVSMR